MKLEFLENEYWWGGIAHHGRYMPIGQNDEYFADLSCDTAGNQSVTFFISDKGRYIWSNKPFSIKFKDGFIETDREIEFVKTSEPTLRSAYKTVCQKHFPFSGNIPEKNFFIKPQYNTWAELTYNQNQQSVLQYAKDIVKNGYETGIITIDDTWQLDYGMWEFEASRFPNPKEMVDELHNLGFKVMLWVAPFISPDSPAFREAWDESDRLLRDDKNQPIMQPWWNGYSAVLDMSKPKDKAWMRTQLKSLQAKYGIDGFKFDGGNGEDFISTIEDVNKRFEIGNSWHRFGGEEFAYHEIKDSFNCAGLPFIQRLRDKLHCWGDEGLSDLIPDALNLSLTGHPFVCPDMVGGGEWTCFTEGAEFDEELVVRFAECSALFPMMQFSVAPWRILNQENQKSVLKAEQIHMSFAKEILQLVKDAAKSGEPIMRPLEYNFPNCNYNRVTDQFMLGENILVAPVITKNTTERSVIFPKGKWEAFDGEIINGPVTKLVKAPLGCLPWYRKL